MFTNVPNEDFILPQIQMYVLCHESILADVNNAQ